MATITAKHYPLEYGHKPMVLLLFTQEKDRKLQALWMQPYLNYDDCLKSMHGMENEQSFWHRRVDRNVRLYIQ